MVLFCHGFELQFGFAELLFKVIDDPIILLLLLLALLADGLPLPLDPLELLELPLPLFPDFLELPLPLPPHFLNFLIHLRLGTPHTFLLPLQFLLHSLFLPPNFLLPLSTFLLQLSKQFFKLAQFLSVFYGLIVGAVVLKFEGFELVLEFDYFAGVEAEGGHFSGQFEKFLVGGGGGGRDLL
jgi:hypothetical protein